MYQSYSYESDEIPSLKSDFMKDFAVELGDQLEYFKEARRELSDKIWPECDRAYHCIGELPKNEGMDWVDKSDLRETDIKDAVDFIAATATLGMMPRDQSWLNPISRTAKQDELVKQKDLLQYWHRKADTRGNYEMHAKQTMIRGTSAIHWTWTKRTALYRVGDAESIRIAAQMAEAVGLEISKKDIRRERIEKITFDGPVVKTIDMQNLWLDPTADLRNDEDLPVIFRQFISVDDLKAAREPDGVTPMYDNLDGIEPMAVEQIYNNEPQLYESSQHIGIDPIIRQSKVAQYVPVYCFHRRIQRFRDKLFADCYIYLAETNDGEQKYKIIRMVENPSDYGHRSIFIDTYQDFLNNAYGIGAVEKSLSAWYQKNVLSALTLQAQLATVFPAWIVIAGMLLNDRKLKLGIGGINPIHLRPSVGTKFIEPITPPAQGQQLGEMAQRWQSEKILSQMGAYGAMMNNPTRSVEESKTATQINTETTTGSVTVNNLMERMTIRSLEPLCQAIADAGKQYGEASLEFETTDEHGVATGFGQVTKEELKLVDKVVVSGFHGMVNKSNEVRELNEALEAMGAGMAIPQLSARVIIPYMKTLKSLLTRLNVPNLEDFDKDPLEVLLQDPAIAEQIMQLIESEKEKAAMEGIEMAHAEIEGAPPPEVGENVAA